MWLSLGVIVIAGMIAYIWSARGFFSAFLHMLCVIVAGALAFAFWEPIAHWILSTDQTGGMAGDLAWGVALAVPFAVLLVILRIACDKLVPFNLDFDTAGNVVGGLVCGLVSGVLSAGIVIIAVGFMRLDSKFMDHQRVAFGRDGSLTREGGLWLPADWITAKFYSTLSNGAFVPLDSDRTLGRLHPALEDEGWAMRMTWEEGKGRNTTGTDSFSVENHYSFTDPDADKMFDDHVNDDPKDIEARAASKTVLPNNPQNYTYYDGSALNRSNSTIEGYTIKFNSFAKEQSGRVIVGAAQVALLAQRDPNDPYSTYFIYPLAVNSQADRRGDDPLKAAEYGRWRFDAPTWIPAAREGNDTLMAFEYPVPRGAKPLALYVKGVRYDVSNLNTRTFTTQLARDEAVRNKSIFQQGGTSGPGPKTPSGPSTPALIKWEPNDQNLTLGDTIPYNTIFQKDIMHDLVVDPETRAITGGGTGPSKFAKNEISGFGTDAKLQVRKFAVNDGSNIIKLRVDAKNALYGFLSRPAAGIDRSAKIVLVDSNDAEYSPVGYVYKTNTTGEIWVYFNPQAPVMSMQDKEMPIMTTSRPDQELVLIFPISKNTKIKAFKVGDRVLAEFKPEVEVK